MHSVYELNLIPYIHKSSTILLKCTTTASYPNKAGFLFLNRALFLYAVVIRLTQKYWNECADIKLLLYVL